MVNNHFVRVVSTMPATLFRKKFSIVAVFAGFVVLGSVLLITSHAATPTMSLEAEDGQASGVTIGTDGAASGGKYVQFGAGNTSSQLANIPDDCSVDVTSQINAFIQSQPDGTTIIFPPGGCYRIDGTIRLADRAGMSINGNGSTFKQMTIPPAKAGISQWEILGGSSITLTNMTVQGVHTQAAYDGNHEWDHNFAILGTQTATLDDVHGRNAGGDFVDIQPDIRKVTNSDGTGAILPKNITLKDSDADITGRNAVSCTGCDTVSIINNKFNKIGYQGIDVEIEAPKWYGRNISVTNNTFGPVQLSDFSASGFGLDTSNLTFANNTITDSVKTCQPAVYLDSSTPRNTIKVTGNTLIAIGTAISISRGTDVTIQNNVVTVTDAGCTGGVRGIFASNVNGGTVQGNDFSNSAAQIVLFSIQQPIINVTACGNRLPASALFDKPMVCSGP